MHRREFIACVALLLLTATCHAAEIETSSARRPNILFILADDLGRECLQAYGGQSYNTPTLDRLAQDGVRFATCYSTPLCSPSRVELMTGRYSFRNYLRWQGLDPNQTTFAQLLRKAGYATALAGKWQHEGWQEQPQGIVRAGFDEYCSYREREVLNGSTRYQGNVYWSGAMRSGGDDPFTPDRYTPEIYTDFLIDFMRRHRQRPFLAYYCMNLLHRPFMPTAAHPDAPAPGESPPHDWLGSRGEVENFPAMIEYLDKMVGKLLAEIDELGLRNDTVVIFTADNGTDNVSEAKTLRSKWQGQMVRGGKYFPTDWGVNVPLMVRWPGRARAGSVATGMVDFTDFLPTLCDLAGAPLPKDWHLDGRSFVPQLTGSDYTPRPFVYSWGNFENNSSKYKDPSHHTDELLNVIRDQRWKLYSNGRLFDLSNDLFEEHPIPADADGEARKARQRLSEQLKTLRTSEPRLW